MAWSQSVRKAAPSDAIALATLAERTFRETFAWANTAQDMEDHCRRSYGECIQATEIQDRSIITLVAECQACLAGYLQARFAASVPSCVEGSTPGEIHRLYVSGEYHGLGLAQALMNAGVIALQERGCDVAWLGVWERNPRAIAFYHKLGFREVGEHVFRLGSDPQRDVVMVKNLQVAGVIT